MIIIQPTEQNSYFRIINSAEPNNNLGIISPTSGQLSIRPDLNAILHHAGTYAEKTWYPGPGQHGGVTDYEHSNDFSNADEAVGYIARSITASGESLRDLR